MANGTTEKRLLYNGELQCIKEPALPSILDTKQSFSESIKLHFLSPTRLKFKNRYTMDFTFRMLAFSMVRRILEIAHFYVPESQPDWDFKELLTLADNISISDKKLEWIDWHRYSNRQHTKMDMGGFIGEISLQGETAPFAELLQTAEMLHVGKGTSFGLGKIAIM